MTQDNELLRLDFHAPPYDDATLERATGHLEAGGLLVYPTETVYGFGCGLDESALDRLSRLKRRSPDHPFLLLIPDRDSVADLRWTPAAEELADVFWPGALTLILEDRQGRYPEAVRGPGGGVAVRRSPHPVARALVDRWGSPLTSTSANVPGEAPARTAAMAEAAALRLGAGEETWVLDGGTLSPSEPSTIVDCTGEEPYVVRAGAVSAERLRFARRAGS